MLAKTWKTILLVICVIAVMFNIIAKIVRAPSFQKNLDTVIEENIIAIDASIFSNTLEMAGQSITESAKEITSTLFNYTSTNSVQEEVHNQEDVVLDYETKPEEIVNEEEPTTNDNSKFKVSFN